MRTFDEINYAVRANKPVTFDELRYIIVAYDVLLSKLKIPDNAVQLKEYFLAGMSDPKKYAGFENSPENPEFILWYKAFNAIPQALEDDQSNK